MFVVVLSDYTRPKESACCITCERLLVGVTNFTSAWLKQWQSKEEQPPKPFIYICLSRRLAVIHTQKKRTEVPTVRFFKGALLDTCLPTTIIINPRIQSCCLVPVNSQSCPKLVLSRVAGERFWEWTDTTLHFSVVRWVVRLLLRLTGWVRLLDASWR